DTFEFVDRGGRIQLTSSLRLSPTFEPLHFRAQGRTYRCVNVDAEVDVEGRTARVRNLGDSATVRVPQSFFAIAGYAPLDLQALLVRYWETHDRPGAIAVVPGDPTTTVSVEARGDAKL